ncbi:MAG: hypothetical protein N2646_08140, partial [Bellilinea sp.]|nr:hypothetical protein [Bellilinea sp.]
MSDKPVRERFFSMILLLLLGMVFSACSGLGSKASETDAQPQSGSSDTVVYKEFPLPGPVAIR